MPRRSHGAHAASSRVRWRAISACHCCRLKMVRCVLNHLYTMDQEANLKIHAQAQATRSAPLNIQCPPKHRGHFAIWAAASHNDSSISEMMQVLDTPFTRFTLIQRFFVLAELCLSSAWLILEQSPSNVSWATVCGKCKTQMQHLWRS